VRPSALDESFHGVFSGIFTASVIRMVLSFLLAMAAAGGLVWYFERRKNRAQFGGPWWKGVGSGFWWSAATVTTTGYGDKIPQTLAGRVVAVIWMLSGLVIVSTFIASVTASLTARHFTSKIQGFEDLPRHRVAVVSNAISDLYLRQHRIAAIRYPTGDAAVQALAEGKVDAFVQDTPLLMYRANQNPGTIAVLPQSFDPQGYGFGFPAGSPLRKSVDVALLEVISDPVWQEIQDRYLGAAGR
jgi:ABC-type amino acid transport substrate-binding protein